MQGVICYLAVLTESTLYLEKGDGLEKAGLLMLSGDSTSENTLPAVGGKTQRHLQRQKDASRKGKGEPLYNMTSSAVAGVLCLTPSHHRYM